MLLFLMNKLAKSKLFEVYAIQTAELQQIDLIKTHYKNNIMRVKQDKREYC